MSETLYRKYRPLTFGEVVSQKAVTTTLINAQLSGRLAHAYLFTGPRGTGKTTVARILARALNCENPQKGEPDNACETCLEILANKAPDFVELDAASNRGIDEIRRLKEEVRFGPQRFNYKVFVLDEAHMLTRDASNALLKSLEEPPARTLFILATTEAHKLLPTIISRCQRLDFKYFSLTEIVGRLTSLIKAEGAKLDEASIRAIAVNAQGSLRDAESILGKVLTQTPGSKLDFESVRHLLGAIDQHAVAKLVGLLNAGKAKEALTLVERAAESSVSMRDFLRALIEYGRKLVLYLADAGLTGIFDAEMTEAELNLLRKHATGLTFKDALRLVDICRDELAVVEFYPLERMAVEMAILKYLN